MNKYQEAFKNVSKELKWDEVNGEQMDDRLAIKELVDRATPKKVFINKEPTYSYESWLKNGLMWGILCPVCHETVFNEEYSVKDLFCPHCGQLLEWEEGEKK